MLELVNDSGDDALRSWLLGAFTTQRMTPEAFVEGFARALADSGFLLVRLSVWVPTLHPELWGTQLIWDPEAGCRALRRGHDVTTTADYLKTPGESLHERRLDFLRVKLAVPPEEIEAIPYPLLRDFARQGASDYCMLSLDPGGDRPPWIALTSNRPGGFAPGEIERLRSLVPFLSLHFQLARERFATQSLLEVYLGTNASRRVLAGEFRRGSGSELRSAMWFCDMRGFTELSDRLKPREVVRMLDAYFELVAGPIEQRGGEILKFIGDAALAVFPIEDAGPIDPCRRALAAAEDVLASIAGWSAEDSTRPKLAIGVGLHLGEVMYGNIGGRARLDFTVIGSSVNEVCRVEALCKPLGCPLLMTRAFADALGRQDLVVLGCHPLQGVSQEQEVLTTPEQAAARE